MKAHYTHTPFPPKPGRCWLWAGCNFGTSSSVFHAKKAGSGSKKQVRSQHQLLGGPETRTGEPVRPKGYVRSYHTRNRNFRRHCFPPSTKRMSENGENINEKSIQQWITDEIKTLIAIWSSTEDKLGEAVRKAKIYEEIGGEL